MRPGLGWRPNSSGHVVTSFAMHAAATRTTPPKVDNSHALTPVMDQANSSSCVGHATSGASYGSLALAGTPLPFIPSPAEIYRLARCLSRADAKLDPRRTALTDSGSEPQEAMRAIKEWGVVPMVALPDRFSDVDPSNVNHEPDFFSIEQAAFTLLVGERLIDTRGANRVEDVRRALAAGMLVTVGFFVDSGFMDWKAGDAPYGAPRNEDDPDGGGHYVFAHSYDTTQDGKTIFTLRNSWGDGAGIDGDYLVTEEWLTHRFTSDVHAMSVLRRAA